MIDEAGAAQRILPKSKQKKVINKTDIEEIVAKIARIPSQHVSLDDRGALKNLDRDLKATVFGQEKAIDALAKAIKMARSGLGNPGKPIGSPSCSAARPASARPKSPSNWPIAWVLNYCVSTCPNTWNATPFRA